MSTESVQINHATAAQKNALEAHNTARVKEAKIFYSNVAGCRFVFADGSVASFVHGQYVTDREWEIKQLQDLCDRGNTLIFAEEVPIQNTSDAVVVRNVVQGNVKNVPIVPASTTGMQNSATLSALSQLSAAKPAGN